MKQTRTLAANVAVEAASKKAVNPYLAHRSSGASTATAASTTGEQVASALTGVHVKEEDEMIVDDRLKVKVRDVRGRKAFRFVEEGTYVKQQERTHIKGRRYSFLCIEITTVQYKIQVQT